MNIASLKVLVCITVYWYILVYRHCTQPQTDFAQDKCWWLGVALLASLELARHPSRRFLLSICVVLKLINYHVSGLQLLSRRKYSDETLLHQINSTRPLSTASHALTFEGTSLMTHSESLTEVNTTAVAEMLRSENNGDSAYGRVRWQPVLSRYETTDSEIDLPNPGVAPAPGKCVSFANAALPSGKQTNSRNENKIKLCRK